MKKFTNALRLILLALLLCLSSFAFWSGEHIWMFKCSLVATEFGAWFVLPCLLLALPKAGRLSLGFGLAAALLFSSAEIRSLPVRRALPSLFLKAFGKPLLDPPPAMPDTEVRVRDLVFDPTNGLSLTFFDPWPESVSTTLSARPCIIVVHSGGWDGGDRHEFARLNLWLARRGIAVASIDYRLAPGFHWPAQRDDLLKARSYLMARARHLDLDPDRFAVLGRSAGAQIAVATAYTDPSLFRAVVDLYGPADLNFAWDYARPDDILDSGKLLRQYTGGSPAEVPQVYASASPRLFASKDSPPTLMIHGLMDRLVWCRQSELLDKRLTLERQGRHLLITLPWGVHAFDYDFVGPGAAISAVAIWNFLNAEDRSMGR
jgi:acetyl esterase/lipase